MGWGSTQSTVPQLDVSLHHVQIHVQELERLGEVTTRAHLTAKPLARKVRSARYPVRLSAYGFALLHHQLQHYQLWLMLHLANSMLRIEVGSSGGEHC